MNNADVMEEALYTIGGLGVRLTGGPTVRRVRQLEGWSPFAGSTGEIAVELQMDCPLTLPPFEPLHRFVMGDNAEECRFGQTDDGTYFFDFGGRELLSYNLQQPRVVLCSEVEDMDRLRFILWVAYGLVALWHGVVAVHASTVVCQGRAVLCLGESGTGKSTHTSLWLKYIQDTYLLNDDSPLVAVEQGEVVAYGSPWSGKTPCYKAERVPVAAFVRLEQRKSNSIRRLATVEAFAALQPSCAPSLATEETCLDQLVATLSAVVKGAPVYRLGCLPDEAAARLCHSTIFGQEPESRNVCLNQNSTAYRHFFHLAEEQLAEGHNVKLAFDGRSMLPTLNATDRLEFAPLSGPAAVGDIVLARQQGHYLVHRVVQRQADAYILQGDNCYGTECVPQSDVLARLIAVTRANGRVLHTDSRQWHRLSRCSILRRKLKNSIIHCCGRQGRRQLRPWYFLFLIILMWAPLNGLGVPLDNYVLGIRMDHLLHASVYVPCILFLVDLVGRHRDRPTTGSHLSAWLLAVLIGWTTEAVQYLLPYRGFDINDMVANTLGVTLGWSLLQMALRRAKRTIFADSSPY